MYCIDVLQMEIAVAASARLNSDLESWLGRYCRSKGVSKTEVIELGLLMVRRMEDGDRGPPSSGIRCVPESRLRPRQGAL